MNTYLDCVPCFLRQSLEAARNVTGETRIHEQIVRDVLRMTAELDLDRPPPFVGQAIHRRLRELTGVKDPYQAAKRRFNNLAMEALPKLAALVHQAEDPLLAAARCAVAANAIDMGIASAITEAEVGIALRGLPEDQVHGDWGAFLDAAAGATDILYLADNAGRVTVAVRGAPVLNDATMVDAKAVGMHELVRVIDNGSDAPGTILDDCGSAFRERFDRADLIIAKGQGNYETLSRAGENIAFWFKVKCPVIGGQVGLPVGTLALLAPTGLRPADVAASQGGRP
jgi:uncharacterized protein with ATP-grasp and redox domains